MNNNIKCPICWENNVSNSYNCLYCKEGGYCEECNYNLCKGKLYNDFNIYNRIIS